MKRQKRNHDDRAFVKGYQNGINGRSRTICPYESGSTRQEWLNGWREGREDHWSGFNRLAQAQKLTQYC
jgi:ribosome modulation factor